MKFTLLIILITTQLANAQYNQHQSTASNFQPSLFIVIGVLSFMFSLTLLLVIYAKFCHRQPSAIHNVSRNENNQARGMFGPSTRFSGIDKTVVEALPFFRFSSLKGSKRGLQCAVCLAEFEEVEILRLLPKCKHGFHIECVDQWLVHHSTCPLCRQKVSAEDVTTLINSSSMRFIVGGQKSDAGDAATSDKFELLLERENDDQRSSRFGSIGGSFKRIVSAKKDEEMHIKILDHQSQSNNKSSNITDQEGKKGLHRLNHQIIVSDIVFKNRWSDVSSSDLMFLNSEMLGVMSSDRFSSKNMSFHEGNEGNDQYKIMNLREEIERKRDFEHKLHQINRSNSISRLKNDMGIEDSSQININDPPRSSLIPADKRSMSEITALSRFKDLMSMKSKLRQCLANSEINNNISDNDDDYVREDLIKRRKKWFPIAKRTVQWFANREKNRSNQQQQQSKDTSLTLDV